MNSEPSELIRFLMEEGNNSPIRRINLGTHAGDFHADELLATAVIMKALESENYDIHIVRSRDVDYLKDNCSLIYDVGGGKYDHHGEDRVLYPNGIPMAACGKILNDVISDTELLEGLRFTLFYAVEANDNGFLLPDFIPPSKLNFVTSFNPTWQEPNDNRSMFRRFVKTLPLVQQIYERALTNVKADLAARTFVGKCEKILEGKFLILDRPCPFFEYARLHQEVLGAVYPRDGQFVIRLSPTFKVRYETRISFPQEWCGKSRAELQMVSGFMDAQFCHKSGFLMTVGSKPSALACCEKLVKGCT